MASLSGSRKKCRNCCSEPRPLGEMMELGAEEAGENTKKLLKTKNEKLEN